MVAQRGPSVLSREERDLLVRLDTKVGAIEATLLKIDSGVNSRLANLEVNSVSKIQFDDHEERLRDQARDGELLNTKLESFQTQVRTWGIAGTLVLSTAIALLTIYH